MSEENSAARGDRLQERVVEEIRVVLARRKMSQAELARRIGESPKNFSRRMTGDVGLSLDQLQDIAEALQVTVTSLLGGAAPTAPFIPQQRRPELVA